MKISPAAARRDRRPRARGPRQRGLRRWSRSATTASGAGAQRLPREQRPRKPDEVRDRPEGTARAATTRSRTRAASSARSTTRTCAAPPYPSQTDVNFAANWPGVEWIIVGLAAGAEPEVRSYLIDGGDDRGGSDRRAAASERQAARLPGLRAHAPARASASASDCGMPLVFMPRQRARSERAPAARAQDQAPVHRRARW